MLNLADLKRWLHKDLQASDKLLLLLASIEESCQVKDIKSRAVEAGFRIPKSWNVSALLGRSKGKAIRTPQGWELSEEGHEHLASLGVFKANPEIQRVSVELRRHASAIANSQVREFVEEAIKCHESKFFRSAVVMSWLGAVAVLHAEVVNNHLAEFNAEASKRKGKWKPAKSADDLGNMRESEFLDVLQAISVIGKNVKTALRHCLDRRNACGHPNSYQLADNTVAAHIEVLVLNVFSKF
ncbi:hypothetical protein WNY37_07960 [Henriciella sp. AS95]|uniref:hypothetical protein n=1 Tax=Henriciella sp. AS95 TaxID=3135782 RepID=UPI00317B5269